MVRCLPRSAGAPLRWLARAALLGLLLLLVSQQVLEYRAQPVSTTVVRRVAAFPRLTLCPAVSQRDRWLLRTARQQLLDGAITAAQFYNLTTLAAPQNLEEFGSVFVEDGEPAESRVAEPESGHGSWRARYYLAREEVFGFRPVRCFTFTPSPLLHDLAHNAVTVRLPINVSPLFTHQRYGVALRLFVHGPEEPNVGDLHDRQLGVLVPTTAALQLRPGGYDTYRVSAQLRRLVSVRRRPCRAEPGYSEAQCLKECLWQRLAAETGCRLPHMVSAGVYLPDVRGPLDHLPACRRLPQIDAVRRDYSNHAERFDDPGSPLSQLCGCRTNFTYGATEPCPAGPPDLSPLPDVEQPVPRRLLEDLRGCGCHPACDQVEYTLHDTSSLLPDAPLTCMADVTLRLALATDSTEEELAFTGSTLVANLGGFVGLVFGFSLLSVLDLAEALAAAVRRRAQTKGVTEVRQLGKDADHDPAHGQHDQPGQHVQYGQQGSGWFG